MASYPMHLPLPPPKEISSWFIIISIVTIVCITLVHCWMRWLLCSNSSPWISGTRSTMTSPKSPVLPLPVLTSYYGSGLAHLCSETCLLASWVSIIGPRAFELPIHKSTDYVDYLLMLNYSVLMCYPLMWFMAWVKPSFDLCYDKPTIIHTQQATHRHLIKP